MISTKGRYALRVLIDLAERDSDNPVPLKSLAQRQEVSEKYMQHIAKLLVDQGLLIGTSGKGGGYTLAQDPQECTVYDVLTAAEGTLAPVVCLTGDSIDCDKADICKTLPMWRDYYAMTSEFFGNITIADLANGSYSGR